MGSLTEYGGVFSIHTSLRDAGSSDSLSNNLEFLGLPKGILLEREFEILVCDGTNGTGLWPRRFQRRRKYCISRALMSWMSASGSWARIFWVEAERSFKTA